MTHLKISPDISFPSEAVTKKFAFLGVSGGGKTYGAGKFAELLHEAGAQLVIIDVIGNWWGLRLAADGRSKGIPIPVLGGEHGDVPLESTGGAVVADLIVDSRSSAVVDISEFTGGEMRRFVTDFATHLLKKKKKAKSPIMIIWEECQDVVPQKVMGDSAKMVGAMEKLIKQGRNYGIGTTLISQRPQAVNKDVLNQTECLLVFQTNGPQERKAIESWIVDKGLDKNPLEQVNKLKKGECFIWSPSWLDIFIKTKISKKNTYDASATPEFGTHEKAKELAPIDLEVFKEQMKSTIEKAKAEDPKLLRKEITELKAQLNKEAAVVTDTAEIKELRQRNKELIAELVSEKEIVKKFIQRLTGISGKFEIGMSEMQGLFDIASKAIQKPFSQALLEAPVIKNFPEIKLKEVVRHAPDNSDVTLGRCEKAILAVLATRKDVGTNKSQLGILSGYSSNSGGFNNSLSKLKQYQYIDKRGENYYITIPGISNAGDFEPLPTGKELHQYWYSKLGLCERKILEYLVSVHPGEIAKETIGEVTEYSSNSGGFNNSLSRLKTLDLIIKEQDGFKASDSLFE